MTKRCAICGNEFETTRNNALYCPTCKTEAARRNVANMRARDKAVVAGIIDKAREAKRLLDEKNRESAAKERTAVFKERLKQGDAFANMQNEFTKGGHYNVQYWEWYVKYLRQQGASEQFVNDISINEPDFATRVVESIRDTGIIFEKNYR